MENPRLSYELQDRTQQAACETPPRMASPSPERLALSAGSSGELPPVDRGRQAWLFLMSESLRLFSPVERALLTFGWLRRTSQARPSPRSSSGACPSRYVL